MPRRLALIISVFAMIAAACSEPEPATTTEETTTTSAPSSADGDGDTGNDEDDRTVAPDVDEPAGDGTSIVERFAGEDWFLGTVPALPVAADPDLEPIRIGMINQEDTPIGSFPEMRFAADAAVNWINAELGGVDGHPIELYPCITQFSPDQSRACAQELVQEDVVALVGGIDVMSLGALPVLEQNGIPLVGGIPAGLAEQQSPNSFAFSGGTAGGMAAMISHAKDNGAEKVLIAYGDFDAFTVSARDYAGAVAESLGMEVELLAFPIVATDFLPVLTRAAEFGSDALIVAAADTACVPVMEGFVELEIPGTLYLVGACAAEAIIDAAGGAHVGVVFSSEGPPSADDIEGSIFDIVTDEYNNGPAKAAGTVGFRGMMNLYALLVEIGADNISRQAIIDQVSQAVDHESFWGHNYTCDGRQVPGLPALCAPQQTLFVIEESLDDITFITDWIDTVELFQNSVDR